MFMKQFIASLTFFCCLPCLVYSEPLTFDQFNQLCDNGLDALKAYQEANPVAFKNQLDKPWHYRSNREASSDAIVPRNMLHQAIIRANIFSGRGAEAEDIVEWLLAQGADPNQLYTKTHDRPLHMAISSCSENVVYFLVLLMCAKVSQSQNR